MNYIDQVSNCGHLIGLKGLSILDEMAIKAPAYQWLQLFFFALETDEESVLYKQIKKSRLVLANVAQNCSVTGK